MGHLRDIVGEAASLTLYTATSIAGRWIRPAHDRRGHRRPVVLVPGFLGRGLAFVRLKRFLVRRGYPVYVADLGYGVGCIKKKAWQLELLLRRHELRDCYVIGHSMGGLIAMSMDDDARDRVRHFITLGTAFKGAALGYLVPLFPAARQLNPRSQLLNEILRRARAHDNLTIVVAQWDEIALPMSSCHVDDCHVIQGVAGHVQLIMRTSSCEQLAELLGDLEHSHSHTTHSHTTRETHKSQAL